MDNKKQINQFVSGVKNIVENNKKQNLKNENITSTVNNGLTYYKPSIMTNGQANQNMTSVNKSDINYYKPSILTNGQINQFMQNSVNANFNNTIDNVPKIYNTSSDMMNTPLPSSYNNMKQQITLSDSKQNKKS